MFTNCGGVLQVSLREPTDPGLRTEIAQHLGVDENEFYLTNRGKLYKLDEPEDSVCSDMNYKKNGTVVVYKIIPRVLGGKGGFGSMLRAIGAQIEKTTNRDACRDLSGRRLRDINEEQRLKRWYGKQNEREEEKVEAKKRKLEKLKKLTEGPALPVIDDQQYNQQRAEMADSVYAAVDKGFGSFGSESHSTASATVTSAASDESSSDTSSSSSKQKNSAESSSSTSASEAAGSSTSARNTEVPKKKSAFKRTMLDEDLDSCSSSDEEETAPKKAKLSN